MKNVSKAEIEEKALKLLNESKLPPSEDYVDVISIARKQGFEVVKALIKDDADGFIIIQPDEASIMGVETDKLIGINARRPLEWNRFIIAHELGHFCLHYSQEKNNGLFAMREHKKGKDELENDADFFAACLLMPKERFENTYRNLTKSGLRNDEITIVLKKRFVTTEKMVERRIEELQLNNGQE